MLDHTIRDTVLAVAQVSCSRCGSTAPGLAGAPLPGPVGRAVLDHACAACWKEWLGAQVILINEQGLSPANPEHFDFLVEQMKTFLNLREPS